jgi:serine/threonine protein kinase
MAPISVPSASPGQMPQYKLLGRIASGGMGAVYLGAHADDSTFSRLVAIKIIHEHLAENRVFVDMLHDEAQVASQLHHPNVVGIIDMGSFRGRNFVVMPYIEGGTLSELVRRQAQHLPIALVARVLIETLRGLHAAHSLVDAQGRPLGLVHRDVSPGNILIGTDGISRVIDFGVAKAASRITHTAPGTVKGKFAYMAPEQAMGEQVDCRADVFSVGVVLWTVLTGKRLFTGKNDAHTIRNLMSTEIVSPSRIRPRIPQLFDQVCMRALQRDRERRYPNAHEMAEELRRAVQASGAEIVPDEIGAMVSEAFADRIQQRRKVVEESRRTPRAVTVDEPDFEIEVLDLDDQAPAEGLTPATPSARAHRLPPGALDHIGTDPSAIARSLGTRTSASISSTPELASSIRYLHTGLTPAEAHSVTGPLSMSQAALDRAAVTAAVKPRGHGKYFAIAVLLMLAGAAFFMRAQVLALFGQSPAAPAITKPAAQPAATDAVHAPGTGEAAQAAQAPAAGPAAAGSEPAEPAGTPDIVPDMVPDIVPDIVIENPDTAIENPDTATANPHTATANPHTATASPGDQATAGATASPDRTPDASGATASSGTDAATPAPQKPGQLKKKPPPRRNPGPRSNPKKPPLEIEKNPYLD